MATFLRRRGVGNPFDPAVYEEDKAILTESRGKWLSQWLQEQMRHFVSPYFSEVDCMGAGF